MQTKQSFWIISERDPRNDLWPSSHNLQRPSFYHWERRHLQSTCQDYWLLSVLRWMAASSLKFMSNIKTIREYKHPVREVRYLIQFMPVWRKKQCKNGSMETILQHPLPIATSLEILQRTVKIFLLEFGKALSQILTSTKPLLIRTSMMSFTRHRNWQ